jgi:hypothetical protein
VVALPVLILPQAGPKSIETSGLGVPLSVTLPVTSPAEARGIVAANIVIVSP